MKQGFRDGHVHLRGAVGGWYLLFGWSTVPLLNVPQPGQLIASSGAHYRHELQKADPVAPASSSAAMDVRVTPRVRSGSTAVASNTSEFGAASRSPESRFRTSLGVGPRWHPTSSASSTALVATRCPRRCGHRTQIGTRSCWAHGGTASSPRTRRTVSMWTCAVRRWTVDTTAAHAAHRHRLRCGPLLPGGSESRSNSSHLVEPIRARRAPNGRR